MAALVSVALAISGCATVPYVGRGPHPQIERGRPCLPVDALGNVLSVLAKLLLWNARFNSHTVSPKTEAVLVRYLDARDLPALDEAAFRLNQYAPLRDLKRLARNRHVAWPYRLLFGLPTTLIFEALLPGRVFPWGDYYNPYTNTVHLYSDDAAITLHEAGHAYDFARRRRKGTYSASRMVSFVDLYQEWQASAEAIRFLQEIGDRELELRAYTVLYPAYASYVGGYFTPIGTVIGVLIGHAAGRSKAREQRRHYEQLDAAAARSVAEPASTESPSALMPAVERAASTP